MQVGADLLSSGKHLFTFGSAQCFEALEASSVSREVSIFSIPRQASLGMSISVGDIFRWKKLRKKMVANVFYARARDSCQTNVMCQLRMFCFCETRLF